MLWLLLFFMTINDLTVFSPGQSAGTLVFLLKRPLSSFVIILFLPSQPPHVYGFPTQIVQGLGRGLIYFLVSDSWNLHISWFSVACPVLSTAGEVRKATAHVLHRARRTSGSKSGHSEGQWLKPEVGTCLLSLDQCSLIPAN